MLASKDRRLQEVVQFRSPPHEGERLAAQGRRTRASMNRPLWADFVAKVFLGWRTKILRAADALCARRCEGPYRFIQNRARTFVAALKSDAAAEKAKDRLSRDFKG